MTINLKKASIKWECFECGEVFTQPISDLVLVGNPTCHKCGIECDRVSELIIDEIKHNGCKNERNRT